MKLKDFILTSSLICSVSAFSAGPGGPSGGHAAAGFAEGYAGEEGEEEEASGFAEGFSEGASGFAEGFAEGASGFAEGFAEGASGFAEGFAEGASGFAEGFAEGASGFAEGFAEEGSCIDGLEQALAEPEGECMEDEDTAQAAAAKHEVKKTAKTSHREKRKAPAALTEEERLEKNRQSARDCRLRKKKYIDNLEKSYQAQQVRIEVLQAQLAKMLDSQLSQQTLLIKIAQLEQEIRTLKSKNACASRHQGLLSPE